MILLFLISKFHNLVKLPCDIRIGYVIILTEWMAKYQSKIDAILEYQIDRIPLWFWSSTYRTLSLSHGIKPLPYDSEFWQILNFQPCQCLRLSTSQCHQKITTFHIIFGQLKFFGRVFPSFSKDHIAQIPVQTIGYHFLQKLSLISTK